MTAPRKVRDRETIAIELCLLALTRLDVRRWSSGRSQYMGGRKAVRRVLAYLDTRFPE
jgi:hypothetical protein